MQEYAAIDASFPERWMTAFEKQSDHRQHLERVSVEGDQSHQRLGLIFGAIISLAFLGGGMYFASIGYPKEGAWLVVGTLASLVSVFVLGKREQSKKLKLEREMMMQMTQR